MHVYKNFIEALENSNTLPSSKDYQQLQRTIEEIVRENERLYSELNYFKTSDPVYEQVQILETTNRHLQQQFNQAVNENNHLRGIINFDEIDYLKSKLGTALEECEQLKLANIKLIQSKSSKQSNENESSINLQLYLKEKADHLHCQLRCRTYQQQVEHLQNTYELTKEKYKQRLQEEKEIFERTKIKYVDYIKNIQRDLQETRRLLEKDAEIKQNQESIYQQMIDERKQLLTNMVDKDTQEREIRHENSLLTSKIHLLEKQMENLHSRIDQTVHEQSQLRRDVNNVRWDINVSSDTSPSSSPALPSRRTTITYLDSPDRTESFEFKNDRTHEVSTTS